MTGVLMMLQAQPVSLPLSSTGFLSGEQIRPYSYSVTGGKFFQIAIDQGGHDFAVKIFDPRGRLLGDRDWRWNGTETASIIAPFTGIYRFEIRLASPSPVRAPFSLRHSEPRNTTAQDRALVTAEAASTEIKVLAIPQDKESLEHARQKAAASVQLWESAQNPTGVAQARHALGFVLNALGKHSEAREQYVEALNLRQSTGDRQGEAETLHNIGAAHSAEGHTELARDHYQRSLKIREEIGDQPGMAATLSNQVKLHVLNSEHHLALEYARRAVDIARAAGDPAIRVGSLVNLGAAFLGVSELQPAIDNFQEALALIERKKPPALREEVALTNNLAYVYTQMDEHKRALELQDRALLLLRKLPEPRAEARVLLNRAASLLALGHPADATRILRDVVSRCRSLKDEPLEAASLVNLGRALERVDRLADAEETQNQALELARRLGDLRVQGSALYNLGVVRFRRKAFGAALEALQSAVEVWRRLGIRLLEAPTRMVLAQVRQQSGEPKQALSDVEAALELVEEQRTKIAAEELRSSYFSGKQDYYRFHIDLLMQLHDSDPAGGYERRALEAAEQSRARALLDLIAERLTGIRSGADPELLTRRTALLREFHARANLLNRLTSESASASRTRLLQEIDRLHSHIRDVDSQIRVRSPHYAGLMQPPKFDASQLQLELDADTILLEYSLGTPRSYLWVVTATQVHSFSLPSAGEIESAARRMIGSISSQPLSGPGSHSAPALALSRKILGPAAFLLAGKRLIIVPDGILHQVPFAALAEPSHPAVPLVVSHELAQVPSASVLTGLRKDLQQRQPAPKLAAVFANPVFDASDERFRNGARAAASRAVTRDAVLRLLHSQDEADAIVALGKTRGVYVASGFNANIANVQSKELRLYRYIHFATHARIHERPELSALILSLVDRNRQSRNGYLTLLDIYNLDLAADLVTLSACETAAGAELKGEGPISLARAFFYAGAARVVATLWKVDDKATAQFMKLFYQGILRDELSPAAALRAAQDQIRRDSRFTAPFYWAGFVLYGEWK